MYRIARLLKSIGVWFKKKEGSLMQKQKAATCSGGTRLSIKVKLYLAWEKEGKNLYRRRGRSVATGVYHRSKYVFVPFSQH